MRKALCVGIDSYEKISDLHGCVNGANGVKAALERNGDGTLNFSTKILCATSFSILQKYVKLNLVIPVGEEHMYYAAINHESCKLTAQGQHYWNLVKKGNI